MNLSTTRRRFVRMVGLAAGLFAVPGAFAEELARAALRRMVSKDSEKSRRYVLTRPKLFS